MLRRLAGLRVMSAGHGVLRAWWGFRRQRKLKNGKGDVVVEDSRVACNRRVHAEVRVTDAVANADHVVAGFLSEQWSFEELESDRYLVSVPVYSAGFAAMDVARAKILDFSDRVADVEIVYLRTQPRRRRQSYLYRSRYAGRRVTEVPTRSGAMSRPRFGNDPGREPWPAWEIYSDRTLEARDLDRLEERFTPNYSGRELTLRQISSPPKSRASNTGRSQWRSALQSDLALTLFVAFEIIAVSILASESPGTPVRIFFAVGGLFAALLLGLSLAGFATGWFSKGVSVAMPAIIFTLAAGMFWLVQLSSGRDPVVLVAVSASAVIIGRGLTHLLRIRPRVRLLASLSVLTALVAVSFGGARAFVSAIAGDSGVSLSNAAVPAWIVPASGVFLLGFLLLGALVAGSGWGWFEYAGGSTTFRKVPEMLAIFLALMFAIIGMMAIVAAMTVAENVYRGWIGEFSFHRTPQITSDFMYRACLVEKVESGPGSEVDEGAAATARPMVVIEGEGGPRWSWDAGVDRESSSIDATRIDAEKYDVVPLDDNVVTCAQAGP